MGAVVTGPLAYQLAVYRRTALRANLTPAVGNVKLQLGAPL